MRLSSEQLSAIIASLDPFLLNKNAKLYLYGSRVDDTKRGGDIDLAILFIDAQDYQAVRNIKHYLLAELKKNLGEQKIDLLLHMQNEADEEPFLKLILSSAVILHSWS